MWATIFGRNPDPAPLPPQRVVHMSDREDDLPPNTVPRSSVFVASKEAVPIRPPLNFCQGSLRLEEGRGVVSCEIVATVSGCVEIVAPAIEAVDEKHARDGQWPLISHPRHAIVRRRIVRSCDKGCSSLVSFDRPDEEVRLRGSGALAWPPVQSQGREWPLAIILHPHVEDPKAVPATAASDPPDGTVMALCIVHSGRLHMLRQLLAWGGNGRTYVMKALYGFQSALGTAVAAGPDSDRCVVCLVEPQSTAILPCGHFCVCAPCGAVLGQQNESKCPLCRVLISSVVKIDVNDSQGRGEKPRKV